MKTLQMLKPTGLALTFTQSLSSVKSSMQASVCFVTRRQLLCMDQTLTLPYKCLLFNKLLKQLCKELFVKSAAFRNIQLRYQSVMDTGRQLCVMKPRAARQL